MFVYKLVLVILLYNSVFYINYQLYKIVNGDYVAKYKYNGID